MSASGSPVAFAAFILIFLLLMRWPKRHGAIVENSRVSLVRRIAAFYIDLLVAMIGVLPFAVVPVLFVEFLVTGEWQWSFERDYVRSTDWINAICMLGAFYGMFWYWRWHFHRQKQTVGQHLLKFKLVPIHENTSFGIRFVAALIGASWWPLWPWTIFKERQDYFWDTYSGIKARDVLPA
jgi:hypothetical protein